MSESRSRSQPCETGVDGRTGDSGDGFLAREIGDVHEGIVERRVDVGDAEDELAFSDLRPERDGVFFLGCPRLLGWLRASDRQSHHPPSQCTLQPQKKYAYTRTDWVHWVDLRRHTIFYELEDETTTVDWALGVVDGQVR